MRGREEDPSGPALASAAERWRLILPHASALLAVARRRCASEADAEDCVQEAMLRAARFERLDSDRVQQFLTATTIRLTIDLQRQRARRNRLQARILEVPGNAAPVDEASLDRAEARWLAGRCGDLPERERAVLELRVEGYDAGETAQLLGVTYKSAESAYTRARNRLRAWAAAMGIAWLTAGRWLRARLASPAGSVLTVASVGCLVVVVGVPRDGHLDATHGRGAELPALTWVGAPPRVADSVGAVPGALAIGDSPAASGRARRPGPAPAAPPRPPAGTTTTVVWVQPTPDGPGVGVQQHNSPTRPIQSIEACLAAGVNLDPGKGALGC